MPKQLTSNDFDLIIDIIASYPDGATIEDIVNQLQPSLPRRTLQRRLATLVATRQLSLTGQGRAVKYLLSQKTFVYPKYPETLTMPLMVREAGELYIPISSAGEEIRELISRPIHQRRPIGYQHTFLDAYEPNVTQYLRPEDRQRLYELGVSFSFLRHFRFIHKAFMIR